jgi:hydroxymethylpyrimidine pyrophosphatase-like HAD family hydrolase
VLEVKAVARYVIGDCEDDSVAEVLESLALHSGQIAL